MNISLPIQSSSPTNSSTPPRPLLLRLVAALAAALTVFVLLAPPAKAHAIKQSYLYFNVDQDSIEGRLELRIDDINEVLGLGIAEEGEAAAAGLKEHQATLESFARPHLTMSEGGDQWDYTFTDIELLDTEAGTFGMLRFTIDETFDEIPRAWDVELDVFFDELPDNKAFVLIESYWDGGIFNNEANYLKIFEAGDSFQQVTLDEPSFFAGLWGTIELGIEHIEIGTDHILFVLVLLLPSVLVFRAAGTTAKPGESGWRPAEDFRSSFWKVMKIATMFTIAHSITLTLAGLGLFELPSRPVEALIAVSIVAAALHNLRPVFREKEWLIAFGFGLFHGLGFAGLLEDLGLDRGRKVWSLLGFNIGVELGQVVIIALVFPILFMLRRTALYQHIIRWGSILMAVIATNWFIERAFDVETGLGDIVDKALRFPRVLAPLALAAIGAYFWQKREADRGALLHTADDAEEPKEPVLV